MPGNEDDGDVSAGFSDGFLDGAEDVDFLVAVQDRGAGLAGVDATNNVGAGLEHQGGVLGALAAGDALNDDLGVLVEVDRHCRVPLLSCVGELGGLVGALVHGGGQGNQRVVGLGQDAAAFLNVVAVEANDQRLVRGGTELSQCTDDALGNGVTSSDATEDVHEHALDLGVAKDNVRPLAMTSADAPPPMSRKLAGLTLPWFSPA